MAAPDTSSVLLRIGEQVLTLRDADGQHLAGAIEAANRAARIKGLPDTLNPEIIDPAKAERFVAALPAQSPETLSRIAGGELPLDRRELGLGAAAPTRAESFAAPFELVIDSVQGRYVNAHTTVPADPALAKARATEAEAAFRKALESMRAIEAAGQGGDQLSDARIRTSAVSLAWRLNAIAWAGAAKGDRAAEASLAAARDAVREHEMPTGALP